MRIAYLSHSIVPSRYANSIQVMKMCQAFVDLGHMVDLYAIPGGEALSSDPFGYYGVRGGFEIRFCNRGKVPLARGFFYAWNVARTVRANPHPDVFYGRDVLSLLACSGFGVPLVYEVHQLPFRRMKRWVEARLFGHPSFARLVTISEALRQDYLQCFPGLNPNQVIVAHDGADLPSADTMVRIGEMNWPGRPGAIQVGYVGHLYPGKGMEIIARLPGELPDIDFHVIGGFDEDVEYWRTQVNCPNIHFHGFVEPSLLPSYYRHLDIVLAPLQYRVSLKGGRGDISRWTSPLKIFEYMSYGKAIVVSDLPVLAEVMRNEQNCLVVPADQPEAWVRAIRRLADNVDERSKLGKQARYDLETQYTWKRRAERVLASL